MVYQWREGSFFAGKKVSAQVVGTRIERLKTAVGGELRPADVVADAKSSKSPLHRLFDWDDAVAANKHRLQTATSTILGSIVVHTNSEPSLTRAFVSVDSASGRGSAYVGLQTALADPSYTNALLSAAHADFKGYRAKYGGLRQLTELFEAGRRIFSK